MVRANAAVWALLARAVPRAPFPALRLQIEKALDGPRKAAVIRKASERKRALLGQASALPAQAFAPVGLEVDSCVGVVVRPTLKHRALEFGQDVRRPAPLFHRSPKRSGQEAIEREEREYPEAVRRGGRHRIEQRFDCVRHRVRSDEGVEFVTYGDVQATLARRPKPSHAAAG